MQEEIVNFFFNFFSERHLFLEICLQLVDGQADLFHGIPVPDGDAVVGRLLPVPHSLKVHGDAVGVPISSWRRYRLPMEPASS